MEGLEMSRDIIGIILGAMISAWPWQEYTLWYLDYPDNKLKQCEAEIPRNQNCVLIAVPEEKSDE